MRIQNFFDFPLLIAFIIAAFLLNLNPEPSITYVTSRGQDRWYFDRYRRRVGSTFYAILAVVGITGLLAKNHYSSIVVRVCGGTYILTQQSTRTAPGKGRIFSKLNY